MTGFDLRPYQQETIDACFKAWTAGHRRIAVQLPTGAGKTVIFTCLVKQARELRGWGTALVLAHREELVEQAAAKFRADDPDLKVGIVKAERNEVENVDVIVGSVQTLWRDNRLRDLPPIDLVVIDEAHHSAAKSYRKIIEYLGCYADGAWLLGVSATLERNDDKKLKDVFQDIPHQIDILDLVPEFLVEPKALQVQVKEFDLSAVRVQAGDLVEKDLAEALERSDAYGVVAASYKQHCIDRSGIVFCPSIATSEKMAAVFREWGFTAEVISSRTDKDERKDILERYQSGQTQVLTNCQVLTEGFDAPHTSAIVIARPTKSRIMYSQMVGRGLRLSPGKEDCLVLDLTGDTGRHQLCTIADLTKYDVKDPFPEEGLKEAAARTAREAKTVKTRGSLKARQVDMLRRATGSPLRDGTGWWLISPSTGTPFIKVTDDYDRESVLWVQSDDETDHSLLWWRDTVDGETILVGSGSYADMCVLGRVEALGMSKTRAFLDPKARWRSASFEECSQGQINFAVRLGIDLEDQPNKGNLSDRISVCTTGLVVDGWVSTSS